MSQAAIMRRLGKGLVVSKLVADTATVIAVA